MPDPAEGRLLPDRGKRCLIEAFGGPCGRRKGHDGHHATIAAHHLDEKDALRAEVERLRETLTEIERLKAKWDAPLTHPVGDMSDPAYAGAAAWAAVGSEAHKIAETALQSDEVTR